MMQFGNLTVVIPTFNRAAILSRNLKDLFAQKQASRLRILIVDDASTDGTFERASFWTDRFPRLTVERNRRRLGFPDNPLYALSRVSTRYLMVMSDEDVPCIKKISELMKLSRNHKFDFLTGAPIYREFKRLNPRDLFSATRYMSGLVYDTDLVKSIIRNHAKDFATIEMFHLYPWTRLALPALLQGRAFSSVPGVLTRI
jgi:glycosyltransferase involved in cell wall biosynthesis